jgi:hypothetical protein
LLLSFEILFDKPKKNMKYKLLTLWGILWMAIPLSAQNNPFYEQAVWAGETYRYAFMDVSPTDTVIFTHQNQYFGGQIPQYPSWVWEYDTIIGNYIDIQAPSDSVLQLMNNYQYVGRVTSVNGQPQTCSEELRLYVSAKPHIQVTVSGTSCLNFQANLPGLLMVVNTDVDTMVFINETWVYPGEWLNGCSGCGVIPDSVCNLFPGHYVVVYRASPFPDSGLIGEEKKIYITIP